ncbi:OmpA family protein [Acinetobacter sp. ANC 5380]|uniref:OmpA family protein n=1 Tax=Acinetobacter terrae TaxID=2731247 RepID=A0A7Y2RIK4_9GAMM|nr:OmpA family protein [Acinetobacter terrae]NNH79403.1 OmpA family protein [Acinetobacter terrae]
MKLRTILLAGLFFGNSLVYAEPFSFADTQRQMYTLSNTLQQYTDADALTRYHAYKARMWLSYAVNQQSERSLTIAGQEALQQAQTIVNGLQSKQGLSLTTPVLSVSQVMRRDLWWQAEYLKQHGAIDKAPESLAHAEVMLVWAAAEYCELGWKHAKEHFNAAEHALYQTVESTRLPRADITWNPERLPSLQQLNEQGCQGVNSDYWPLIIPKAITETLNSTAFNQQKLSVENVVHFALDRADLNVEAKVVLDRLSTLLLQYPEIQIALLGYTDLRASDAYNLKLSQRRIQRVRDYLVAQGVSVARISEKAKGKQDWVADPQQNIAHAKSRRVVIEFYDAEVHVQPQWRDLQPER